MLWKIIKLWFSGINRKSNYKSLVDLFKGRECGCNLTIAKQLAVWRLNTTAKPYNA